MESESKGKVEFVSEAKSQFNELQLARQHKTPAATTLTKTNQYQNMSKILSDNYEWVNTNRVTNDFMEMMLSNCNISQKRVYLNWIINIITDLYGPSTLTNGLTEDELSLLKYIVNMDDAIYHDALLFFAMYALQPLRDWMLYGNITKKEPPPRIGRPGMLELFLLRNDKWLGRHCEALLNGHQEVDTMIHKFVVGARSEYGMTVGSAWPTE